MITNKTAREFIIAKKLFPGSGTGTNLFDWSTRTEGYRINWTTGRDYADATAIRSDFIPVNEGENYVCSVLVYVICYDSNKTYLGCISLNGEILKQSGGVFNDFQIPDMSGCTYIKIMSFGSESGITSDTTLKKAGSGGIDKRQFLPLIYGKKFKYNERR